MEGFSEIYRPFAARHCDVFQPVGADGPELLVLSWSVCPPTITARAQAATRLYTYPSMLNKNILMLNQRGNTVFYIQLAAC